MIYLKAIFLVIFFIWKAEGQMCIPRSYFRESGIVCVCNATYCDSTPHVDIPEQGNFNWYVSSKDGLRLSFSQGKFSNESQESFESKKNPIEDSTHSRVITITVNREKQYQRIYGFGGAFTDSAGINIRSLSENTQEMLMQSYFGHNGSRYSLGRIPIGCSDFSTRFYTYDDVENDKSLEHFQLAEEDLQFKLPIIQRALKLSPGMKLVSAVWSPPLWMKTNNVTSGPSVLKKEYYQTYADYIVKFLEAYGNHNVSIWAVSTGNEPADAFVPYLKVPSMGWTSFGLGDWLADNLGPSIALSPFNRTHILAFDDQRYLLTWFSDMTFSNRKAFDAIDGIAVHWYLDTVISPNALDKAHQMYPNKFLLLTEASNGFRSTDYPKVRLGYWKYAENYVLDIIENMRHFVTGWIDWNLALNMSGGPNWIQNFVDSSIIVNPEKDEFYKQPMYYAIKHFSRFVEPNSVRIDSSESGPISSIAFETTLNTIAVVLYNRASEDKNVEIIDSQSGTIRINLAPRSIHTLEYR